MTGRPARPASGSEERDAKLTDDANSDAAGRRRAADRVLVGASRRAGRPLAVLVLTSLALAGLETALPALLGRAVDSVVGEASGVWVVWCAAVVAVLLVCDVADDLVEGATVARATSWLRHSLTRKVLDLGPRRAGRFPAGDVAGRLVGNAGAAGRIAPDVIRTITNLVPAVGGIVALALIDPWLCVTFAAGLPLVLRLLRRFARDSSSMATGYLEAQAGLAGRLIDALSGIRTIAAAGTVDREIRRVLEPLPELQRFGMGAWRVQIRMMAQDALVVPVLEVLVLAVAGFQLSRGRLSPGEFLAAGQYVQLASTIGAAVGAVGRLARARASAARVAEVLDEPTVVYGTGRLADGGGRVELRDVTVDVGGRKVLDGLSLDVPSGALVALVGRSGSGKSLVAGLVGRLVDPDAGTVLVDGVDVSTLDRAELRREVVYGFERPSLIGDTVGDAIAFGVDAPPFETVVAASCAAQADAFVRHLPKGYATALSETPMSGGEAQRVGLARTFAHAGRVVVLDDVASSLDTFTEHQIARVLTGRLSGHTRLVVAHRASTAARADAVVWLDQGRARAVAPHQLLWADPEYRALFDPGLTEHAVDPSGDGPGPSRTGRSAGRVRRNGERRRRRSSATGAAPVAEGVA